VVSVIIPIMLFWRRRSESFCILSKLFVWGVAHRFPRLPLPILPRKLRPSHPLARPPILRLLHQLTPRPILQRTPPPKHLLLLPPIRLPSLPPRRQPTLQLSHLLTHPPTLRLLHQLTPRPIRRRTPPPKHLLSRPRTPQLLL
jgi:hypothetical protein